MALIQESKIPYEVIVVNDNSVDDTQYILEEFRLKHANLNIIKLSQEGKLIPGKKYPLSIGIRSAKYDYLLLTDADCLPATEQWLNCFQRKFYYGCDIVLGYSPYFKKPGILNKFIRFETFHTALQYLSYALAGMPYMGVGRNLAYQKKMFLESKGFASINHVLSGDDDLFINKVATANNTTICIHQDSFTYTEPKQTFKAWYRQKKRHFTTAKFYKFHHKFLLAFYNVTLCLILPCFIVAMILYKENWIFLASIYGGFFIIRFFIQYKALKKLAEKDLWLLLFLQDFLFPLFYVIHLPNVIFKREEKWA